MPTYDRMLDKRKKPTETVIERFLGEESFARLGVFEAHLAPRYDLNRELIFPFGDNYGWGYKFTHGRKQLCYAFFEEGAFTITLQIPDSTADEAVQSMLPQTQEIWANRHASGEEGGGWIHYRVLSDDVLPDLYALIALRVPAAK